MFSKVIPQFPQTKLDLVKLPDIVKLYDLLINNKKSSNLNLPLVSEQHNYGTRSASLQHLNPDIFQNKYKKIYILGCYYRNDIPLFIRNKPTRTLFKKHFTSFILLSIDNSKIIYLFTMRLITLSSLVYFLSQINVLNERAYNYFAIFSPFTSSFTILILLNILYSCLLSKSENLKKKPHR